MKKNFLIAGVLALISMQCIAQTTEIQRISFGPKAGVNFSNLTNVDDAEAKTGFTGGVFLIYSPIEKFGVSVDLLYSMEGASYKSSTTVNSQTSTYETSTGINYIRLPIAANYFFGQYGDKFRPKILLGPSLGFLASVKQKAELTVSDNSGTTTSTIESTDKSDFSGFDIGATIGAGFNLRLAEKTWLNTDIRYYAGFVDIRETVPSGDDALNNTGLSVTLGVAFGIGN